MMDGKDKKVISEPKAKLWIGKFRNEALKYNSKEMSLKQALEKHQET